LQLFSLPHYNHSVQVESGLMADESSAMLSNFFKQRRLHHKANKAAVASTHPIIDQPKDSVL
jgi:hypothetical protein